MLLHRQKQRDAEGRLGRLDQPTGKNIFFAGSTVRLHEFDVMGANSDETGGLRCGLRGGLRSGLRQAQRAAPIQGFYAVI